MKPSSQLQRLPAVETVLQRAELESTLAAVPRATVVGAVRDVIAAERDRLKNGSGKPAAAGEIATRAAREARRRSEPRLRRVINGTGIVLHTNLGRAPLPRAAQRAVAEVAAGYSSLEYDLETGRRGRRGTGVESWLERLTGAEEAAVVNNGAGAILLALSAVASGKGVIVSRGELVEIGGSFRVPEVMEKSGARLIEVGSTNRTHLRDYERAFSRNDDVAAILRVHPSNFRVQGFTGRPELAELAKLAKMKRVPLIEDLGSGALVDVVQFGLEHEPTIGESLAAGCSLVTCSGDKLLGGAQAGLILGSRKWVARVKKDPLARALRLDKLALTALEATLALYADPARVAGEVPALAMLRATGPVLKKRAARLAAALEKHVRGAGTRIVEGAGEVGGGSLPLQTLPGPVVELSVKGWTAQQIDRAARAADPPVIGTIRGGRFRLDPRTMTAAETQQAAKSLAGALEKTR